MSGLPLYFVAAGAVVGFLIWEIRSQAGLSRLLIREIAVWFIHLELLAIKAVRLVVRPKYVLVGECHKTGLCCQQILADPPRFIKSSQLWRLFAAYHQLAHRFTAVARGPNDEIIFSCGHLRSDNRCGIYRHRPLMCRTYPAAPLFSAPKLLPGCSYSVAHRNVAKMTRRASLPVLNPSTAVHHPTPIRQQGDLAAERFEDYELVDIADPGQAE